MNGVPKRVQIEILKAYEAMGKGAEGGAFVDHTRNGAYLYIDTRNGIVRQMSEFEYRSSRLPKMNEGVPRGKFPNRSYGGSL